MAEALLNEEEIFTIRKKIKNVNDSLQRRSMAANPSYLSEREDAIGAAAAAVLKAQQALTELLHTEYVKAAREYNEIVTPFLEKLLNVSLSEPVTFPVYGEHRSHTCRITGLNHISITAEGKQYDLGVSVSSIDRRCTTTENIVVLNNKPYFLPEDLY